jgi:hypothetical protein
MRTLHLYRWIQLLPLPFLLSCLSPFFEPARASSDTPSWPEHRSEWLSVGDQKRIEIPDLIRFTGESPQIGILTQGPKAPFLKASEVLIRAKQAGTADFIYWRKGSPQPHRIRFQIHTSETHPKALAIAREISDLPGLEVSWNDTRWTIRGRISQFEPSHRYGSLLLELGSLAQSEVTFSEAVLSECRKRIESENRKESNPEWSVISDLGGVTVLGSANDLEQKTKTERMVRSRCSIAHVQIDSLPDRSPDIHFQIYLIEAKSNALRSWGFQYPGTISGAFQINPTHLVQNLNWDVGLTAMESNGRIKVLSRPEIVVRAPGEASLFSGGELPIRSVTQYHSETTWKPFGLSLKIKVLQLAGKRVRLEVGTEMSSLDLSIAHNDVPGIKSNRMQTQVDATLGRPLVLSGLTQNIQRKEARGIPWLRSLPVLGALFGSEDFLEERSELLAVLIPESDLPKSRELPSLDSPREFNTSDPLGSSSSHRGRNQSSTRSTGRVPR